MTEAASATGAIGQPEAVEPWAWVEPEAVVEAVVEAEAAEAPLPLRKRTAVQLTLYESSR